MDRRICNAFWAYNGVKFWVMRQLCRNLLSPRQGLLLWQATNAFFVRPTHTWD